MSENRVLSVGQCGPDHGSIARTFQRHFGMEVVAAATADAALEQIRQQSFALVLVNRIFDQDGFEGLELIRQLKGSTAVSQVPIMLVSNHEDAQAEAVAAGALPGFGKASLGQPGMIERVAAALKAGQP